MHVRMSRSRFGDAAFVHGTVLDVDGGRTGVAVIAG
jgi:hypothetical protein